MERSLQKLGKTPEEAKQIADRIKAKTKYARSHGGSEPDLTPIRKDAELTPEQWEEKIEDLIYDQQYKMIKKKYGAAVADKANYGWGVSGDEHYVSIATKVYVGTGKVLLSEADYPSLSPTHDWRDY